MEHAYVFMDALASYKAATQKIAIHVLDYVTALTGPLSANYSDGVARLLKSVPPFDRSGEMYGLT
jgi:hypothetical protein